MDILTTWISQTPVVAGTQVFLIHLMAVNQPTLLIAVATLIGVWACQHQLQIALDSKTRVCSSIHLSHISISSTTVTLTAKNLVVVWALSPQSTSFLLALSSSISSACSSEPGDGGHVSSRPTAPSSLAAFSSLSWLFPVPCYSLIMPRCAPGRWLVQQVICSGLRQMTGSKLLPCGPHNSFGCLFLSALACASSTERNEVELLSLNQSQSVGERP